METTQKLAVMKISQLPEIKNNIKIISEDVEKRIKEQNLEKLVATPESIQTLKKLRATFNKELKMYSDQDKVVRDALQAPYKEIKDLLKSDVMDKLLGGVGILSDTIGKFETKVKDEKKVELQAYFKELCISEKIDFLTWESLGITINLSVTVKGYRKTINDFIEKVQTELALVNTHEFKAEILVEYKGSLNVADAITKVQTRKKKEAEENERIKQEVKEGRINAIEDLGMVLDDMVATYEYPDNLGCVFISVKDIEKLDTEAFTSKIIEIERAIQKAKATAQEKLRKARIAEGTTNQAPEPAASVAAPVLAPKLFPSEGPRRQSAPVKQTIQEATQTKPADRTVTASFEVTGPYLKLKALGQYMKVNGLDYKNLK